MAPATNNMLSARAMGRSYDQNGPTVAPLGEDQALGFPHPTRICGHRYFKQAQILGWGRRPRRSVDDRTRSPEAEPVYFRTFTASCMLARCEPSFPEALDRNERR